MTDPRDDDPAFELVYVDSRRGRGTGRAALVCAIILVIGLLGIAVGFAISTAGGEQSMHDFAWAFTMFVLPALVLIAGALFVAALTLGIISLARVHFTRRRPAIVALLIAVAALLAYVAWIAVFGSMLVDYAP